jgi:hypothetical protein
MVDVPPATLRPSWLPVRMPATPRPARPPSLTEPGNRRDVARYQALPARRRTAVRRRAQELHHAGITAARSWTQALDEATTPTPPHQVDLGDLIDQVNAAVAAQLTHIDPAAVPAGAALGAADPDLARALDAFDATPVGLAEIAIRLHVTRYTVDQWVQRGLLPAATWTVGGRKAWATTIIDLWAIATGRHRPGS